MGCADELSAPWAGRSVQIQRPADIGSLWLGYIAAGLKPFTLPGCIDLIKLVLPRIVTFQSAAQTPSMAVLPLPSRKTAPASPGWRVGRQFSPELAPLFHASGLNTAASHLTSA